MLPRKGQGLSMQTIVIAILSLLVLVILVLFITGTSSRIFPFITASASCEGRGGQCVETSAECDSGQQAAFRYGGCGDQNSELNKDKKYCCIPVEPK
ncbi:hypothetical protein J4475_01180 [Candidatus Woesearchaeota archaeon]|nr:hypothetical protein [Candidatus Woesearchaeota archaeon]OGV92997.1 MAG: hypothetical protein A3B57_00720 [Microgenomates group bacterium RIFCSPLOWO2_01_FULL_47_10]